jgi:hypothetical protein
MRHYRRLIYYLYYYIATCFVTASLVYWSEFLATDPEVPDSIHGHYKKKKVVGLERGPLSLVSTTEELLGRNSSSSSLEIREYGDRDSSTLSMWHPLRKTLALTSPTSGGRSVGIVRLRTLTTEFFLFYMFRSYDHLQVENILLARITQMTTDPLFYNSANIIVLVFYI